jgi:DNA-binding response OmpR family regulator
MTPVLGHNAGVDTFGARSLVVIEDDESIRGLLEQILRQGGYRVLSTSDPTRAVDLAKEAHPDLILCDIAMPVLDGYGVVRALQADPQTAEFPVVFLTAHREFTERVQAFRFGVVDYITKPFAKDYLLRKIEHVIETRGARPGVRAEAGEAGLALLDDVVREGRTGILRVKGRGEEPRAVIQMGRIVEETGPLVPQPGTESEFHELDPSREHIVVHDPTSLPRDGFKLPDFSGLPDILKTVLVVDDNRLFRAFVKDVLTRLGFTVHEAASGDEGLRLALAKRPWLILSDLSMPGLDGFELCRSVRSHALIRHTPIIFLSGWDDYETRDRGLEAGADEFVSKGTPLREVLIRIQLTLQRYSDMGRGGRGRPGMEGRIEAVGVPGVLQICHLGRLTGICSIRSGTQVTEVSFRDGEIVGAERQGLNGVAVVHDLLSWTSGRFEFTATAEMAGEPLGESFEAVLLEGCRLLDERRRLVPDS